MPTADAELALIEMRVKSDIPRVAITLARIRYIALILERYENYYFFCTSA